MVHELREKLDRTVVLVGLMGAGKSTIGRRLAQRLDLPFVDADTEIESAAGCSIPELFERYGEAEFRKGEKRVIGRLLEGPVQVLATGGGAFMDPETRALVRARGVSVWLRAELPALMRRVRRRDNRPLLQQADPEAVLRRLMEERYPVYATADLVVDSTEQPHEVVVEAVLAALAGYCSGAHAPAEGRTARAAP